jgi:ABC-type methionine transport system permease subunit
VLGKLTGLRRGPNLVAVFLGGALGSGGLALLAQSIGPERTREIIDQPALLALVLAVLLGTTYLAGRWVFGRKARAVRGAG